MAHHRPYITSATVGSQTAGQPAWRWWYGTILKGSLAAVISKLKSGETAWRTSLKCVRDVQGQAPSELHLMITAHYFELPGEQPLTPLIREYTSS